jgi:hypothetical protein
MTSTNYADLALSSAATSTSPLRYFLDPQEDNNFIIWIVDDTIKSCTFQPVGRAEENDTASDDYMSKTKGWYHSSPSIHRRSSKFL